VILAQVIHHGNSHREQVRTILTVRGLAPPDISAFAFAFGGACGRVVPAGPSTAE
jgi:hypothetical protein